MRLLARLVKDSVAFMIMIVKITIDKTAVYVTFYAIVKRCIWESILGEKRWERICAKRDTIIRSKSNKSSPTRIKTYGRVRSYQYRQTIRIFHFWSSCKMFHDYGLVPVKLFSDRTGPVLLAYQNKSFRLP